MHKAIRIGLWICQAALAVMFVFVGAAKFTSPLWARMFARWGYPDHFYLAIGVVEVAAGLALLVPRLAASSAAVLLVVVVIGAGAAHRNPRRASAPAADRGHVPHARRRRVGTACGCQLAQGSALTGMTRRSVIWVWTWIGWTGLALFLGMSSSLAYMAVGNPPRWSLTIRMALAEVYVQGVVAVSWSSAWPSLPFPLARIWRSLPVVAGSVASRA